MSLFRNVQPLIGLGIRKALVFLLCISPTIAALARNRPSGPDPTLEAEAKANREGRVADAERILQDAIRAAGQTESPQLSNNLRSLGIPRQGKARRCDGGLPTGARNRSENRWGR